jgi:tetratricopeptide (TPR) repeat protein
MWATVVVISIAALLAALVFSYPWAAQYQLSRQARRLESLVGERPQFVEQKCQKICRLIERRSRLPESGDACRPGELKRASAAGIRAYVHAQILLATVESNSDRHFSAESRIKAIREYYAGRSGGRPWLLKYYLAVPHVSEGAITVFLEALGDAEESLPDHVRTRIESKLEHGCRVRGGMNEHDLKRALRLLHAVKHVLPDEIWPLVEEGSGWLRLGALDRARSVLEQAILADPQSLPALLLLVRALAALGNKDEALSRLRSEVANRQDDARALSAIAAGFVALGAAEDATRILKTLPADDPEIEADVFLLKGKISLLKSKVDKAIDQLTEAMNRRPGDLRTRLLLAEACSLQGGHDRARRLLEECSGEKDPEYLFAMATELRNTQQTAEAADWYARCAQTTFRRREAQLQQLYCLINAGRYEEARQVLNQVTSGGVAAELHDAQTSFYHGVILYLQKNPASALPYFERALRHARKLRQNTLAILAAKNRAACCLQLAYLRVREQEYDQAAKAYHALLSYIRPEHALFGQIRQSEAACHVKSVIQHLDDPARDDRAAAALAPVIGLLCEQPPASAVGQNGQGEQLLRAARLLSGGLHSRQQRHEQAAVEYEKLLERSPDLPAAQFGVALCRSRTNARAADGLRKLETMAGRPSAYTVRAALAVADRKAAVGDPEGAAKVVFGAASSPGLKNDPWYGEARCRSVLYTLRAGHRDLARELTAKYFTGDRLDQADGVIGALLAHFGDCPAALEFLEAGVPASPRMTTGARLLFSVYRQRAAELCEQRQYADANTLLGRARQRNLDRELNELQKLTELACDHHHGSLTAETLKTLDACVINESAPQPAVVHAAIVAHQRFARDMMRQGRTRECFEYWEKSQTLWLKHIRHNTQFWRDFVENYNLGKQYKLDREADQLEQGIVAQLAQMWLHYLALALQGSFSDRQTIGARPFYEEAAFFWKRTCELVGNDRALVLFDERINVMQVATRMVETKGSKLRYELFRWLHANISPKREYATAASNLALEVCLEHLGNGQIAEALPLLDDVGTADPQFGQIVARIKRMPVRVLSHIASTYAAHELGVALRNANRQKYAQGLLHVIIAFAGVDVPGGLQTIHVDLLMPQVIQQIVLAMVQQK